MRIAGLLLIATGGAAFAQVSPCPAPAPFYTWDRPVSMVAGEKRERGEVPRIVLGRTTTLTLAPTSAVRPELPARRPGLPSGYAGLVSFVAPIAGTYRVGLSAPAWVEVGTTGRAIASAAHAPAPECAPLRKTVDYRLAPGTYVLQLTAAPAPVATVAVVPLP